MPWTKRSAWSWWLVLPPLWEQGRLQFLTFKPILFKFCTTYFRSYCTNRCAPPFSKVFDRRNRKIVWSLFTFLLILFYAVTRLICATNVAPFVEVKHLALFLFLSCRPLACLYKSSPTFFSLSKNSLSHTHYFFGISLMRILEKFPNFFFICQCLSLGLPGRFP
jgi:hypothetical protein